MSRQTLHTQKGLSLVEVLVSVVLCTVGALALATTFVGAAALNRQVANRQKALEFASQEVDRMKSLAYEDVAMPTRNKSGNDISMDADWAQVYCPLSDGCIVSSALNSKLLMNSSLSVASLKLDDPRELKIAAQSLKCSQGQSCPTGTKRFDMTCRSASDFNTCPKVRRGGVILYTYVYWNSTTSQQYKMVTVVARYRDPKPGLTNAQIKSYTSVQVTSIIADIPQLGQIQ